MQVSVIKNFKFKEFISSNTAFNRGIDNFPKDFVIISNLLHTAFCMQQIRDLLKQPIRITSGYRCEELNRALGGSKTSQHCKGEAVDFICPKYGSLARICEAIIESGIEFDQLIKEPGWIHISFSQENNRREIFNKNKAGLKKGLYS
jgi:hypothetical protein